MDAADGGGGAGHYKPVVTTAATTAGSRTGDNASDGKRDTCKNDAGNDTDSNDDATATATAAKTITARDSDRAGTGSGCGDGIDKDRGNDKDREANEDEFASSEQDIENREHDNQRSDMDDGDEKVHGDGGGDAENDDEEDFFEASPKRDTDNSTLSTGSRPAVSNDDDGERPQRDDDDDDDDDDRHEIEDKGADRDGDGDRSDVSDNDGSVDGGERAQPRETGERQRQYFASSTKQSGTEARDPMPTRASSSAEYASHDASSAQPPPPPSPPPSTEATRARAALARTPATGSGICVRVVAPYAPPAPPAGGSAAAAAAAAANAASAANAALGTKRTRTHASGPAFWRHLNVDARLSPLRSVAFRSSHVSSGVIWHHVGRLNVRVRVRSSVDDDENDDDDDSRLVDSDNRDGDDSARASAAHPAAAATVADTAHQVAGRRRSSSPPASVSSLPSSSLSLLPSRPSAVSGDVSLRTIAHASDEAFVSIYLVVDDDYEKFRRARRDAHLREFASACERAGHEYLVVWACPLPLGTAGVASADGTVHGAASDSTSSALRRMSSAFGSSSTESRTLRYANKFLDRLRADANTSKSRDRCVRVDVSNDGPLPRAYVEVLARKVKEAAASALERRVQRVERLLQALERDMQRDAHAAAAAAASALSSSSSSSSSSSPSPSPSSPSLSPSLTTSTKTTPPLSSSSPVLPASSTPTTVPDMAIPSRVFCTYVLVAESLAFLYLRLGLRAEALKAYDDLVALVMQRGGATGALRGACTGLAVADDIRNGCLASPSLGIDPQFRNYRVMLYEGCIAELDLASYLFARRAQLLLALGRMGDLARRGGFFAQRMVARVCAEHSPDASARLSSSSTSLSAPLLSRAHDLQQSNESHRARLPPFSGSVGAYHTCLRVAELCASTISAAHAFARDERRLAISESGEDQTVRVGSRNGRGGSRPSGGDSGGNSAGGAAAGERPDDVESDGEGRASHHRRTDGESKDDVDNDDGSPSGDGDNDDNYADGDEDGGAHSDHKFSDAPATTALSAFSALSSLAHVSVDSTLTSLDAQTTAKFSAELCHMAMQHFELLAYFFGRMRPASTSALECLLVSTTDDIVPGGGDGGDDADNAPASASESEARATAQGATGNASRTPTTDNEYGGGARAQIERAVRALSGVADERERHDIGRGDDHAGTGAGGHHAHSGAGEQDARHSSDGAFTLGNLRALSTDLADALADSHTAHAHFVALADCTAQLHTLAGRRKTASQVRWRRGMALFDMQRYEEARRCLQPVYDEMASGAAPTSETMLTRVALAKCQHELRLWSDYAVSCFAIVRQLIDDDSGDATRDLVESSAASTIDDGAADECSRVAQIARYVREIYIVGGRLQQHAQYLEYPLPTLMHVALSIAGDSDSGGGGNDNCDAAWRHRSRYDVVQGSAVEWYVRVRSQVPVPLEFTDAQLVWRRVESLEASADRESRQRGAGAAASAVVTSTASDRVVARRHYPLFRANGGGYIGYNTRQESALMRSSMAWIDHNADGDSDGNKNADGGVGGSDGKNGDVASTDADACLAMRIGERFTVSGAPQHTWLRFRVPEARTLGVYVPERLRLRASRVLLTEHFALGAQCVLRVQPRPPALTIELDTRAPRAGAARTARTPLPPLVTGDAPQCARLIVRAGARGVERGALLCASYADGAPDARVGDGGAATDGSDAGAHEYARLALLPARERDGAAHGDTGPDAGASPSSSVSLPSLAPHEARDVLAFVRCDLASAVRAYTRQLRLRVHCREVGHDGCAFVSYTDVPLHFRAPFSIGSYVEMCDGVGISGDDDDRGESDESASGGAGDARQSTLRRRLPPPPQRPGVVRAYVMCVKYVNVLPVTIQLLSCALDLPADGVFRLAHERQPHERLMPFTLRPGASTLLAFPLLADATTPTPARNHSVDGSVDGVRDVAAADERGVARAREIDAAPLRSAFEIVLDDRAARGLARSDYAHRRVVHRLTSSASLRSLARAHDQHRLRMRRRAPSSAVVNRPFELRIDLQWLWRGCVVDVRREAPPAHRRRASVTGALVGDDDDDDDDDDHSDDRDYADGDDGGGGGHRRDAARTDPCVRHARAPSETANVLWQGVAYEVVCDDALWLVAGKTRGWVRDAAAYRDNVADGGGGGGGDYGNGNGVDDDPGTGTIRLTVFPLAAGELSLPSVRCWQAQHSWIDVVAADPGRQVRVVPDGTATSCCHPRRVVNMSPRRAARRGADNYGRVDDGENDGDSGDGANSVHCLGNDRGHDVGDGRDAWSDSDTYDDDDDGGGGGRIIADDEPLLHCRTADGADARARANAPRRAGVVASAAAAAADAAAAAQPPLPSPFEPVKVMISTAPGAAQ